MYTTQTCETCQTEFDARITDIERGRGRFCSQSCSSSRKRPKEPNVTCALCGTEFYKAPSRIKASRTGLFFCTRVHKDEAQRIGGIKAIQPSHYGTGNGVSSYRAKAFALLPNKCKVCGYDKYLEVLEVNHIDCDRSNNDISNLEILCPTHHTEHHFETKTGIWGK